MKKDINPSEKKLLMVTIYILSQRFNDFVIACTDDKGEIKAPKEAAYKRARECLPSHCSMALSKKKV
jgi:hypothetical protein